MTREQAAKVIADKFNFVGASADFADKWVDVFSAFGMLKLDAPKTIADKFADAVIGRIIGRVHGPYFDSYVLSPEDAAKLLDYIRAAGLKVVENK